MSWFLLALLSAIFAALTAILAKIGLGKIDANFATIVRSFVMAGFLFLVGLSTGRLSAKFWETLDQKAIFYIVLSGVAGALSWLFYFWALKVGLASKVAPIDRLSVVFVLIFAGLFLGERLTLYSAIGAILICLGAVLLAIK